jgi:hypothetical protein
LGGVWPEVSPGPEGGSGRGGIGTVPQGLVKGQLFTQGGAAEAEHGGGATLITLSETQHLLDQGAFDLAHDEAMEVADRVIPQMLEIEAHGVADAFA